jgi:hypothetical protein
MGVKVHDENRIPRVLKELETLGKRNIRVGVMGGEIAEIAAVHEFGARIEVTPKMRKWFAAQGFPLKKSTTHIVIPERSFIRAGFDEKEKAFIEEAKKWLIEAFRKGTPIDTVLDALGLQLQGMMQTYLRDLDKPPLSKMTIKMTKRSNPLVHTGHLLRAIVYEVV